MRAIIYEAFGGSTQLKLIKAKVPTPKPGEVLVRIRAAGVNPCDWKMREGQLQRVFDHAFPLIPGFDLAGDVEALGENVNGFKPGDRVFAYALHPVVQGGCYADYCTVQASQLALIPSGLNYVEAAALPIPALTVWQALFSFAGLASGQYVLIHGGSGGVGSIAIQVAKSFGAHVMATSSRVNCDYLIELGADRAFDYTDINLWEDLRHASPRGFDTVLDSIGGSTLERSYGLVRDGGALVTLNEPASDGICRVLGIRTRLVIAQPDAEQLAKIGHAVVDGAIKIPPIDIMKLEDAAKAMDRSQTGHMRGKMVLSME